MINRILTNWTFVRVLYFLLGNVIIVHSAINHQWFGAAFGGYFAAMGLFGFGCASGNCFGDSCRTNPKHEPETTVHEGKGD